jgi:V8-like Glu-specific endopeptidase
MTHQTGRLGKIFTPPGDTRSRISPTTSFPYNCIGQIESTFGENEVYTGTGTLIDSRHVLTCAHNIFDNKTHKLVKAVRFACARNGNTFPYGDWVKADDVFIPDDYKETSPPNPNDPNFDPMEITPYLADYGVIRLAKEVENGVSAYPALYPAGNNELANAQGQISIAGYPGDKPAGTMWNAFGSVELPDDPFLLHQIATMNGQSGASVLAPLNKVPPGHAWIVGIHVAGSDLKGCNWAVRITEEIVHKVLGWT